MFFTPLIWVKLIQGFGFSDGSVVKNPPMNAGDRRLGLDPWVRKSPGGGNGNSLHLLAWEILWTEEPGRLQFMGSQRVGHKLGNK